MNEYGCGLVWPGPAKIEHLGEGKMPQKPLSDHEEMLALGAEKEVLMAENGRLRAALLPLAVIPLWRDVYPDGPEMFAGLEKFGGHITAQHVRSARTALAAGSPNRGGVDSVEVVLKTQKTR